MAIPLIDNLVHETTTDTGTGNLALTPYSQSFNQAFGNGATTDVYYYFIQHRTLAEWEWGTGHNSDATHLVRDTVIESSNANAHVNFSAGTKDVCNDLPADAQRIPITADTIYHVNASTGNDTTGDGSSGAPWATIQHAANHVMYNITSRGFKVVISIDDGTYPENITLGPHQVFGLDAYYSTPELSFSSTATPTNVVIAPTTQGPTWGGTQGATISVQNSAWSITGGLSLTRGTSGNIDSFAAYNNGKLFFRTVAIVFNDHVDVAFDAELSSNIEILSDPGACTIEFTSTVGCLALVDQDSAIDFYPGSNTITFDVDPGFNSGTLPGMWRADFGGNSRITSRVTYIGSTAASPSNSAVKNGNMVYDLNAFMPVAKVTISPRGIYNNVHDDFYRIIVDQPGTAPQLVQLIADAPYMRFNDTGGATTTWDIGSYFAGGTVPAFYFFNAHGGGFTAFNDPSSSNFWFGLGSDGVFAFGSAAGDPGPFTALDTGISRAAAGIVAVGNSTAGDASGTLHLTQANNPVGNLRLGGNDNGASGPARDVFFDLFPNPFLPSAKLTMPAGGTMEVSEVGVYGTADVFFAVQPITGGYSAFSDNGDTGLLFRTVANVPILFRPGDVQSVAFYNPGTIGLTPVTVSTLYASPTQGMIAAVTDGDAGLAWGATVVNSGAGATYYVVTYNGTNWTVMGK